MSIQPKTRARIEQLEQPSPTDEPPIVFVSYSHKDEAWKDKLRPHLEMLEVMGRLSLWDDRMIDGGDVWYPEIREAMEKAGVAVCLISPDFLGSKFCIKEEVAHFISQREQHGMKIVPILVRPCYWQCQEWLSATQMIPHDGKSLALDFPDDARQDQQLAIVTETIFKILDDPAYRPLPPPAPNFPPLPEACIDIERLPVTGMDLFGRRDELIMLGNAWTDNTRIVALKAWGGVGKSTLINKWTERLAKENYWGADWVFAWSFHSQGTKDRTTSADAFIDEALRFFGEGAPVQGSPWARGEHLAKLIGEQKSLLLLDGLEPLQDKYQGIKDPALARLIECLAVENAGLCVITTREKVKELEDFPHHVIEKDLEQISPDAGRALLRVKRVRGSDAALERASKDFGNHALAVNLLASYLKHFADGDIANAATIPDLPDVKINDGKHARRVMAAFAKKFENGPELNLLHVIGLFDRPADNNCITALREPAVPGLTEGLAVLDQGGWRDLLEKLRQLGLLAKASHHDPDELDAHPLVREHFGERLRVERGDAWKAGHERLYEHLKASQKIHRPDTLAEMAPLFQAVHHGCQAGRRQETLDEVYHDRIIRRGEDYLVHKLGAFGADLGLVASFFDPPFAHPAADLTAPARAWLLNQAAFRLRALGRLGEAVAPMQAGLELRGEQEKWANAARIASNLSELQLALGDVAAAVKAAEVCVDHADRSGDDFRRMANRTALAAARHQAGVLEAATALFEEAEQMQAKRQPDYPRLYSLQGYEYCDLLLTQGQAEAVQERARQTLEWALANRASLLAIALDHLSLGRAASALGDRDEARRLLNQAVDGLREAGHLEFIPRGLLARAAFFRAEKEPTPSRRDLDEAMRIATRCGLRLHECDAHLEYARLEIKDGRQGKALQCLEKAEELIKTCGYHCRDEDVIALKDQLRR